MDPGPDRADLLIWPEAQVPLALRVQVRRLQDLEWPGESAPPHAPVHDPALRPVTMMLVVADRVVAALDLLSAPIVHLGQTFAACGVSAVVTDPDRRGRGLGHALVVAARSRMAAAGADLAIFSCDAGLVDFYVDAGFEELPGTVLVGGTRSEPLRTDELGKRVLGCFFSPAASAAAGGFRGAVIELYPGKIDRLW